MMSDQSNLLVSLCEILKHIREVEQDVAKYSAESTMKFSKFLEKSEQKADDDVVEALQYQDIISQQLSATSEAIDHILQNIEKYIHSMKSDTGMVSDNIIKLDAKMQKTLEDARLKKAAFSGKTSGDNADSEVEFF